MARKRFSEREVIETLAWQGIYITCYRCKKPFVEMVLDNTPNVLPNLTMKFALKPEREHLHEYKLGGADKPYNCRYSCAPCHSTITNGTKATSAGSSKHKIAKVRRLTRIKPKLKKRIPSPPMASGKTIWPKRGFAKKA